MLFAQAYRRDASRISSAVGSRKFLAASANQSVAAGVSKKLRTKHSHSIFDNSVVRSLLVSASTKTVTGERRERVFCRERPPCRSVGELVWQYHLPVPERHRGRSLQSQAHALLRSSVNIPAQTWRIARRRLSVGGSFLANNPGVGRPRPGKAKKIEGFDSGSE
jgi:hypothetical protein